MLLSRGAGSLNGDGNHMAPWQFMFLLGIATQVLKLLLYGIANRQLNLRVLVTTNGFPSLHAVVLSRRSGSGIRSSSPRSYSRV